MDISKELTKMIKGIKLAKYYFFELKTKTKNQQLIDELNLVIQIFDNQLKAMVSDAKMADYRLTITSTTIPIQTKLMLDFKLLFCMSDTYVRREAYKSLRMGIFQGKRFLEKHPHLESSIRVHISNIIRNYQQLSKNFEIK